jgi:hypothetical protein
VQRHRIHHRHEPAECGAAVASWKGWDSPLRPEAGVSSCAFGGHDTWWDVVVEQQADALALLPPFVAERSTATRIGWSVVEAPATTKENQQ